MTSIRISSAAFGRTIAALLASLVGCAAPASRSESPLSPAFTGESREPRAAEGGIVQNAAPRAPVASAFPPASPPNTLSTSGASQQGHCPAGMAAVGGGAFRMGERGTIVAVHPFCLDITEVTSEAYEQCVKSHRCTDEGLQCGAAATYGVATKRDHPINCVTWAQADRYCRTQGKRLPKEEEWEWAARGQDRGFDYPWGNSSAQGKACWSGGTQERDGTCKVGEFTAGDVVGGFHDLAGNVWEWTASAYNGRDASRVNKGGGFISNRTVDLDVSNRYADEPTNRTTYDGFRCAK